MRIYKIKQFLKTRVLNLLPLLLFTFNVEAAEFLPAPDSQIFNASDRIEIKKDWDFFFSGSFIYWQANQKGLEAGFFACGDKEKFGSVIEMNFDYNTGFKACLGLHIGHDQWDLSGSYLRYKVQDQVSACAPGNLTDGYIRSIWNQSFFGSYIAAIWKLDLELFDLLISKGFRVGKNVSLTPNFGIRSGWIDQDYDNRFTDELPEGPQDLQNINYSASWLIGTKMGIDSTWKIFQNFRLFANLGLSLVFQHFKIKTQGAFVIDWGVPVIFNIKERNKKAYLIPNLEIATGIGWGRYFWDTLHFDLSCSYDFLYFADQNLIRLHYETANLFLQGNSGDLSLQGLTITGRLDF